MFVFAVLAPPEWVCREIRKMNPVIAKLHEAQLRKDLPEFRPGDTVKVNVKVVDVSYEAKAKRKKSASRCLKAW